MDGSCLLYTSDAADERSSVDLGGRRILKKKKYITHHDSPRRSLNTIEHETDTQIQEKEENTTHRKTR